MVLFTLTIHNPGGSVNDSWVDVAVNALNKMPSGEYT